MFIFPHLLHVEHNQGHNSKTHVKTYFFNCHSRQMWEVSERGQTYDPAQQFTE